MTNAELISKLNSLKNVNPDKNWLKSNRELLLSQVSNSGAENLSVWRVLFINVSSVFKSAAQPAYALGVFVFLLLTGSLFSGQLLASAKPNDSLYIARIISEKVKLTTTFNSVDRNKMEVKFASEHAQDISAILSDPAFNNEANQTEVAKLNHSFNEEVDTVKNGISRLSATGIVAAKKDQPDKNSKTDNSDEVIIADSAKDGQGIQVSEDPNQIVTPPILNLRNIAPIIATATSPIPAELRLEATSTDPKATSTETEKVEATETDKIIDEAKQLFDSKDYKKASDKLNEAYESIK